MFMYLTSCFALLALVLMPGLILLRSLGYVGECRRDVLIAAFSASLALGGALVQVALFVGLYTPALAWTWLLGPCLGLAWLARTGDARLMSLLRPAPGAHARPRAGRPAGRVEGWVRLAVWCAGGALLAVALLDAASSPMTSWDAVITWDKWAHDWARRHHLYNYLFGYPQLLPMFGSLLYKVTGAGPDGLAAPAWVLHALHPLLGLLLAAASARTCARLGVPSWPMLLWLAGAPLVQWQLGAGTADLLVTALVSASVALYLATADEPLTTGRQGLLVLLLWAAVAAKTTGVLALAAVLALELGRAPAPSGERRRRLIVLVQAAAVALLLNLPLYVQQWVSAVQIPLWRLDPTEVHFTITQLPAALRAVATGRTSSASEVLDVFGLSVGRAAPATLALVALPWLGALVAAACARRTRPLAALTCAYVLAWRLWLAYDTRNLLPVFPLLALVTTCGALTLLERAPVGVWRRALVVVLSLPLALPGGRLASHLTQTWPTLLEALPQRRLALQADLAGRVRIFFPGLLPEFALIRQLDPRAHGAHLLAASFHYRWFPGSVYPLSSYDWGDLRPGDLLLDTPPRGPAVYLDDWWPVRRDWYWLFVYAPGAQRLSSSEWLLTGWHPPRVLRGNPRATWVEFGGVQSLVAHNVLPERPAPGALVAWRVEADATPGAEQVQATYMVYDARAVWPGSVSLHTDRAWVKGRRVAYTGLLRLGHGPLSMRPVDGVLVGIASDVPGTRLHVRDFRVAVVPPRHRPR